MAQVVHLGHFPVGLCPQSSNEVGAGTSNPIGVSLETAMKWYWKVKTWSMSVYLAVDPAKSATRSFANGGSTGPLDSIEVEPPENEKGFVCARETFLDSSGGNIDIIEASLFLNILKNGNSYYPYISLGARSLGIEISTDNWDEIFLFETPPYNMLYDAEVYIDGIQIPAKTNAEGSTINLVVAEEWEFN